VRRAENTLKCKDFRAEGQTLRGDSYTDGKTATPCQFLESGGGDSCRESPQTEGIACFRMASVRERTGLDWRIASSVC
jgi:hypothetical protein